MVTYEYEKCVHFEDGLRDSLSVFIAPPKEQEFAVLVDKANIVEEVKRVERQNRDRERGKNKRDSEPSSTVQRPKEWAKPDGPVRVGVLVTSTGIQPCGDCGRRHPGECYRKLGACLQCRYLEHWIREHPNRADQMQASRPSSSAPGKGASQTEARQPALVYVARCQQDRDALDVITGTFFICDVPYTTLIDITSTHSYVASTVSKNLGISVKWIVCLENLVEIPFGEFNLILGMGWLVEHRVSLDCATKRIVLRTVGDKEIVVISERRDYMSNLISALVAETLVRKGCKAFVAYVSVSVSRDSSAKDIRTVREFLNSFLEELLGLPLNREV
ncbi:uncharacterized protein LOC128035490 [Gossypium raimondii]|uniref:uncharacterized protein LOC128035490 n=1 Tax=Gossypium raimondii TaxID=29730 RepID=UPI00227A6534|nr:uncharacterized protein LOC128035490 [Gossypium raimondii]